MEKIIKITSPKDFLILLAFLILAYPSQGGLSGDKTPKVEDPIKYSFPALGASMKDPKVRTEWNRYHDSEGLNAILANLHKAFPQLTKIYSLGKSVQGRELWVMEITSSKGGDADRKPGMYIDGNIHGNEVQAGEVVAYTAWYLCEMYGHLDKVTELLDEKVFYLLPSINPDGRDQWFHAAQNEHSSRTGLKPYDNDHDGLVDEDDVDDLDGDGSICLMRIRDLNGRWKPDPSYPKYLMIPAKDDEPGEFTILGYEGIDNDGDGEVNEDVAGGYDTNRNWGYDWQPNYIQYGAQDYPFSLPEPRAISDFILSHPNIAAMQSYHNAGGMILRSPGREGGATKPADEKVMSYIGQRGEKMLPFYHSYIIWKDLYTTWGNEVDWMYGGRGILSFTNEMWTPRNLYRSANDPTQVEEADFMKYVLLNDGVVEWHEFNHPQFGKIEIGGTKKEWGRMPPSFLLEEECHRNMAFTLYHADMMPILNISEITVEKLGDELFKIWVTIENQRLIPTRTQQDVDNHIGPPDVVSIEGKKIQVISAGRVKDRFFKKVEAVQRRPERVEIDSIDGMGAERVQFIVSGSGKMMIKVDSAKGGIREKEAELK